MTWKMRVLTLCSTGDLDMGGCVRSSVAKFPEGGYENKALFNYRLDWHDSMDIVVDTHNAYIMHLISCWNTLLLGGAVWADELAIFSIRVALVEKKKTVLIFLVGTQGVFMHSKQWLV